VGHVLVHIGPVVASCVYASSRLSHVTLLQWLTVPAMLLFGSYFVYWFHRFVLHRPTRWAYFGYKRHTLEHHRFYDYDHITADERDDLHITLFPWWSGGSLSLTLLLGSLAFTPLVGPNVPHLVMFMSALYLILYEFVHSVSHQPDSNPLTRLPVLSFLREHHRLHHDPALMGKYNFNVVIPLFDWWFGALVTRRPDKTEINSP
jgi:sterol desaturase/sphingolipid hydroxylase (fatty acid hydroxylase superfamily)